MLREKGLCEIYEVADRAVLGVSPPTRGYLVDRRVYPAINIERSGTRKEELLLHPEELKRVWTLRKAMNGVPPVEAMELLIGKLKKVKTNVEFLMTLQV